MFSGTSPRDYKEQRSVTKGVIWLGDSCLRWIILGGRADGGCAVRLFRVVEHIVSPPMTGSKAHSVAGTKRLAVGRVIKVESLDEVDTIRRPFSRSGY